MSTKESEWISEEGIALARQGHPGIDFRVLDVEKENRLGSRFYTSPFSRWVGTSVMFVAEKDD
jgi:hypothetical protein